MRVYFVLRRRPRYSQRNRNSVLFQAKPEAFNFGLRRKVVVVVVVVNLWNDVAELQQRKHRGDVGNPSDNAKFCWTGKSCWKFSGRTIVVRERNSHREGVWGVVHQWE